LGRVAHQLSVEVRFTRPLARTWTRSSVRRGADRQVDRHEPQPSDLERIT